MTKRRKKKQMLLRYRNTKALSQLFKNIGSKQFLRKTIISMFLLDALPLGLTKFRFLKDGASMVILIPMPMHLKNGMIL